MKTKIHGVGRRGWMSLGGQALGVVGLALLPKCPACFMAYAGVLAACGVGMATILAWSNWLLVGICGLVLCYLLRIAVRLGRPSPVIFAGVGFVALLANRFQVESEALRWGGLTAFAIGCVLPYLRRGTAHVVPSDLP